MKRSKIKKTFCFPCSVLRDQKGQTVIEALVALTVLMVGFMAVFNLLVQSIHYNKLVSDEYTATYLAAEGIELTKNLLDANVAQSSKGCTFSTGKFSANGDHEYDYTVGTAITATTGPCPGNAVDLLDYIGRKLFYNGSGLYGYTGSTQTNFVRLIRFEVIPASGPQVGLQVNSIVSWPGGNSINLEDRFYASH